MIVSFIADLKLTADDQIKIVEFGSLQHSGFLGYTLASGGRRMREDIVHPYIESLGYPYFHMKANTTFYEVGKFCEDNAQAIDEAGNAVIIPPAGHYLQQTYMMLHRDYRKVSFHNHEPVFMMAMDNKAVFMALGAGSMGDYMPDGGFVTNEVSEELRSFFEDGFPEEEYIVKMPESAKGIGTMLVCRDQLFDVMHAISNPAVRDRSPLKIAPEWDEWYSPLILWQSKVEGKPVEHRGALYDPTMRVVMTAHFDRRENKLKLEIHDAYWKYPRNPLGQGNAHDALISYSPPGAAYGGDFNARAAAGAYFSMVSDADKEIVWRELHKAMPPALWNLLNRDAGELAHNFLNLREDPGGIKASIGLMTASMGNYFDGYDTERTVLQRHFPPQEKETLLKTTFRFPEQLAANILGLYEADPQSTWAKYLRSLHHPRAKHRISRQFYEAVLQYIPRPDNQLVLPLGQDEGMGLILPHKPFYIDPSGP